MVKLLKSWPKNEKRLTIPQFSAIHDYYLEKFPLKQPYPRFSELSEESLFKIGSALGAVEFETKEGYRYKPGIEAATAYLYFVNKSHFLINGNKRASLAAALGYLKLNNHFLITRWEKLYEIATKIAVSKNKKSIWRDVLKFVEISIIKYAPELESNLIVSANLWITTNQ